MKLIVPLVTAAFIAPSVAAQQPTDPDRTVERRAFAPDRELLDSLSLRAVRITLGEGESQVVALRRLRR
jgi:hypothetical protein